MNPLEDKRNLIDAFKGMDNADIVRALDARRSPLELAIENLSHDFNIGTIIRNANAFNFSRVHILGRRQYNRRGAMVTDKYLHIDHFASIDDFVLDAKKRGKKLIAIENNRAEAKALSKAHFDENTILIFGSESDGISTKLLAQSDACFYIEQLGSTRSINVGCASAIAMYEAVKKLGLFS